MSAELTTASPATEAGAIVEVHEGDIIAQWQASGAINATSVNVDDEAEGIYYLALRAAPHGILSKLIGHTILIKHWLLHPVNVISTKDGECEEVLRLALLAPDGTVVSTCSDVIARDWAHVVRVFKKWPADPPIACEVAANKGKQAGDWLQLVNHRRANKDDLKKAFRMKQG